MSILITKTVPRAAMQGATVHTNMGRQRRMAAGSSLWNHIIMSILITKTVPWVSMQGATIHTNQGRKRRMVIKAARSDDPIGNTNMKLSKIKRQRKLFFFSKTFFLLKWLPIFIILIKFIYLFITAITFDGKENHF